jgi:hypothetical protein
VLLSLRKADGGEGQGVRPDLDMLVGEVGEVVIPINYSGNWQGDMKRMFKDYI